MDIMRGAETGGGFKSEEEPTKRLPDNLRSGSKGGNEEVFPSDFGLRGHLGVSR